MTLRRLLSRSLPLAPLLLATAAHAHPGHPHPYDEVDEFDLPGTLEAVMHPFSGLDHLVAALAVGCLAYAMGRRLGGLVTALFLGALAMGWSAGRMGFALPMLEQGLALSLVAVGGVLALGTKSGALVRMGVVATIGFWHGSAHSMEMTGVAPAIGLICGTGLATVAGTLCAAASSRLSPAMTRYAGASAALVGVILVLQRLG